MPGKAGSSGAYPMFSLTGLYLWWKEMGNSPNAKVPREPKKQVLLSKFGELAGPSRYTGQIMNELDLLALDEKLRIVLPLEYQDNYEDVQPVSMGSAGLKYDVAGRVAWGEIWGSFCDLAMAGGPPHKGKLLEPATAAEIEAEPGRYNAVLGEICRGIRLVTELVAVEPSSNAGWVRVICPTRVMAGSGHRDGKCFRPSDRRCS